MRNNSQSNHLIMVLIVVVDFLLVNGLLQLMTAYHPWFARWTPIRVHILILLSNIGLVIAEILNPPIIQRRAISSGDIVKRVLLLSMLQGFFARYPARCSALIMSYGGQSSSSMEPAFSVKRTPRNGLTSAISDQLPFGLPEFDVGLFPGT